MEHKRLRLSEADEATAARHEDIAARVESAGLVEERLVALADREDDTDMSLDTLEAVYIGQARSTWKGVPLGKSALDWQMYATLIEELKPRTIVDIGSWAGGSALFFADFAQMLVGEDFHKVVSLDITLRSVRSTARQHPKIQFHECSTERFQELFTDDFVSALPRPWLVSEDAHYHFAAVMARLHAVLQPGDYLVVEDTSLQMHDWFAESNAEEGPEKRERTAEAIQQLRRKREIFVRYCTEHADKYRCDTKYVDMFGYNVGKHWNSIVKRRATAEPRRGEASKLRQVLSQEDLVDYSDEEALLLDFVPARPREGEDEKWHSSKERATAEVEALHALQRLHGRRAKSSSAGQAMGPALAAAALEGFYQDQGKEDSGGSSLRRDSSDFQLARSQLPPRVFEELRRRRKAPAGCPENGAWQPDGLLGVNWAV
ncbi:unnamed protein product [Effrenium voratum]|uniref:Rhamnosyl O-methyltransferase n=1 Tax=Effrenium voratum TaxID=2562239 RepID=A0AA36MK79_9DINO|nr:unnamed protein product [Effrenium voratum]